MQINDPNVKISVKFLKENPRIIANVSIAFNTNEYGWVTIKGFIIWVSKNMNSRIQEDINITPPAAHQYGKWITQVFIENKKNWYKLEQRIYDAYIKAKQEKSNPSTKRIQNEDIDPEDIPI